MLKLGIVDQSPVANGATAMDAVRQTLELARVAERLGYSRYWVAEHHSTNSFAGAAPEVLIPQVAAATSEIRVGSGGVMLSHYSPLKVAEQFRMLEALFPGRIDLGIGRAAGGDRRTSQALAYGRGVLDPDSFPRQMEDLIGWMTDALQDEHPFRRVRAMPRVGGVPEFWLLGSGGSSAGYAAHLGCAYSFAQFISGVDGSALVADYRGRIARGQDRGNPSPEQAEAELAEAGIPLDALRDDPRVITGDPERVRRDLRELARRYGVDEVMVVTVTHSFEARVRSYELLAEAMELTPRTGA